MAYACIRRKKGSICAGAGPLYLGQFPCRIGDIIRWGIRLTNKVMDIDNQRAYMA